MAMCSELLAALQSASSTRVSLAMDLAPDPARWPTAMEAEPIELEMVVDRAMQTGTPVALLVYFNPSPNGVGE